MGCRCAYTREPLTAEGYRPYTAEVGDIRCTQCGATELEPGFIEDTAEVSSGYTRWVEGPLKIGGFSGAAKRRGRSRRPVHAYRCTQCDHLELFARRPA